MLKKEWERVKHGEIKYLYYLTISEFFGGLIIITFFVLFFLSTFPEYFPGIRKS